MKSWRDGKTTAERGYGYRWQQSRLLFLQKHPLCQMCKEDGLITPATVVDHKEKHEGDQEKFWDTSLWQSLCKPHHDSHAQKRDKGIAVRRVNLDGTPDGW